MGTEAEQQDPGVGFIQRASGAYAVIYEATSDMAYGRRGGSLYPLILVIVAAFAVLVDVTVVSIISLALLAVWIGGKR